MSKRKKSKGRLTTPVATPAATKEPLRVVATPRSSSRKATMLKTESDAAPAPGTSPLVFGRATYTWLGGGFLLIILGFLLMTGGRGDDPTVFDESVIYSFRRITLAPIIILSGLGVAIYAIFKK